MEKTQRTFWPTQYKENQRSEHLRSLGRKVSERWEWSAMLNATLFSFTFLGSLHSKIIERIICPQHCPVEVYYEPHVILNFLVATF